jgi:hypothetical protein
MTFLASLSGERLFFDGDHSTGVGGDMRGATAIATQALAYYAMGDTIASRSVNLAALRGAQALETGTDRALFDSEFGRAVDAKLHELYEKVWTLLRENRSEVLAVGHALEMNKTLTGDDVEAIMEGGQGLNVDGRPYRDPAFLQMIEKYHAAVVRAHKEHAGVASRIPVPVPPIPPSPVDEDAAALTPHATPSTEQLSRPPERPDVDPA